MDAGVHLPQILASTTDFNLSRLLDVVATAQALGFAAISTNDHFSFHRPWLDGPTLLAAVAQRTDSLDLATTIALPSLRGPVQLAAALNTLARLAPGQVVAGVGAGSSSADHELAGIPFEDRWQRFDESVRVLRTLLRGETPPPGWAKRLTDAGVMTPPAPIPVWVASWGSPAGLRRVARLGDGWLASAYNTTPAAFARARRVLADEVTRRGRDIAVLPAAVATMWTWIADDNAQAERILSDVVAPLARRDPEELRDRVCVGTPPRCVELLSAYAEAGCSRMYFWPVLDEVDQLHRLAGQVLPKVRTRSQSSSG